MKNEITFGLNPNKEGLFDILRGQYVTLCSRNGSGCYTGRIVYSESPEHICLRPSVVSRQGENKCVIYSLDNLPLYVVRSSIEGVFVKSKRLILEDLSVLNNRQTSREDKPKQQPQQNS